MVIVVVAIVALSLPHLTLENLEPPHESFAKNWVAFTGVILALSGVESIANLTGVMKLDPGATMDQPKVAKTSFKAILVVAIEVVFGTALLGWAMLSLPPHLQDEIDQNWEHMLRFLGREYGSIAFGITFGRAFELVIGVVVGALLLSAVNTAVAALIGLFYMMARDGEMPRAFAKLNPHGVPWLPTAIAVGLPVVVVAVATDLEQLAGLYAIGVVGAITVNLGSCSINKQLDLDWLERTLLAFTFLILLAVEFTIARTKPDALFFAVCVLGIGLSLRAYAQRRAGLRTLTVTEQVAATVVPESISNFRVNLNPGQSILVAARGLTPVLRFALEEAHLRQGSLYVLYVKELAVAMPGPLAMNEQPRWQDDPHAAEIMYGVLELGRQNNVSVIPLYSVSESPAGTILDLAATLGADLLVLGTSQQRRTLASLLKGNVVNEVAKNLPENIRLIIYG
jgi:amino acid transporter/nucleotide-binding universal stress UspA family protein